MARPAELLLDKKGIIRKRFLTDNWRVRVRPEDLIEVRLARRRIAAAIAATAIARRVGGRDGGAGRPALR